MSALVLEWQRSDAVRVGWVPPPARAAIPAAIVGPPGQSGSGGGAVTSVNARVGPVVLTKADVGLGNVDDTSDAAKPISSAVQAALDAKQPLTATLTGTTASFTTAKDTKLSGIAVGATANDTDANLRARSGHTGTQSAATISDFTEAAQDVTGAMVAAAGGTYSDAAGTITFPAGGGGADPLSLANVVGAAPASGIVKYGRETMAGQDMPAFRTLHSSGVQLFQSDLARTRVMGVTAQVGASSLAGFVMNVGGSVQGTATTRTLASTNRVTRQPRLGYVSAATAGSFGGYGNTSVNHLICTLGTGSGVGGFRAVFRFAVSDPATVSGARMFVGLSSSVVAPTNVDPASLTNVIGVAQLATSSNLHIVFGGSAAQTAIDLGVNFPADTLSADLYELMLFSDPNDNTKVGYRVERINTGDVASGTLTNATPGTTLPASTTMLGMRMWRTNNATALAVAIDLVLMAAQVEA